MAKNRHTTHQRQPARSSRSKAEPKPSLVKKIILFFIYFGIIGSIVICGFMFYLSRHLPTLDELINPKYDLPTQIYDRNGELITEFYGSKRRVLIPITKVPKVMIQALLAVEDSRFYSHFGIDPIRMVGALIVDITQGRLAQGASTLTQQTARLFLLTKDKKWIRKFKEILLALKIESQFTKDQILELYLNKTFFGHRAYGIEAAAQGYFSKNAGDLNLAEAAMIAGLPQLPSRWAPTYSIENATKRRNIVLKAMENSGYITKEERIKTAVTPIRLNLNKSLDFNETSYYTEHIRRYLYNKYGKNQLYAGGLKVYTMMDLKAQIVAQNSLRTGLVDHDRRQGYRGPTKNLFKEVDEELSLYLYSEEKGFDFKEFEDIDDENKELAEKLYQEKAEKTVKDNHFIIGGNVLGVVTKLSQWSVNVDLGEYEGRLLLNSMRWARKINYDVAYYDERLNDFNDILKRGDVVELEIQDYDHENKEFSLVLTQKPIANGGVFVMNPIDGEVLAMAGGYDFRDSEFNRAIQGKRQSGSTFKTIVYSLALDSSFTLSSMLDDTPFVGEGDSVYKPNNYSKKFKGKMTLREALVHSKNMPSIRLLKELGPDAVIAHARKLGITSHIPEDDLTIVLGSASLTLKESVVTFAIYSNGGLLVEPSFISRIEDRSGNVIEELGFQEPERVMSEETAFLMTSILQDVVKRSSGRRAQAINRPSAGKTGSSNNYVDALYVGYVPQLIAGVYVGFDKNLQTLGENETGSRASAPIWTDVMKELTAPMAILPFEQPDGINMIKINVNSGLLDCDSGGKTKYEYYKAGTEPTQCHRAIAAPLTRDEDSNEFQPDQETLSEETLVEEL